jgi:hypothetical protein
MDKFECRNLAFHSWPCCDTCWNNYPEAKPDEMFMFSERWREVVKKKYVDRAMLAGFTKEQAEFLYER